MRDFLGNPISVGDTVLIPKSIFGNADSSEFAVVTRFLRTRIEVSRVNIKQKQHKLRAFYSNQLLIVDAKHLTMHELTKGKNNV